MKTCEDCGCRIYEYGCVNCNEIDYIEAQDAFFEAEIDHDEKHGRYGVPRVRDSSEEPGPKGGFVADSPTLKGERPKN